MYKLDNVEVTDEQLDALIKQREESRNFKAGGDYYISLKGNTRHKLEFRNYKDLELPDFNQFRTEKHAARTAKQRCMLQLLSAFREWHSPDWEEDWNDVEQDEIYIFFDHDTKKLMTNTSWKIQVLGVIYMPEECAESFIQHVENGDIELDWYWD